MVRKIDDAAYAEGQKMFRKKATLRSILEPIIAAEEAELEAMRAAGDDKKPPKPRMTREEERDRDARNLSRVLGFADAFLDHVRR